MTIGLGEGAFLLVVNDDYAYILHRYGDTGRQQFWSYEFDLLGSYDVIGHVIEANSLPAFRRRLKTHLFTVAFENSG